MTPDYRQRIEAFNAPINAFVDFTQEQAGDSLAWAAKSNIAVQGLPLTAGCEAYRTRIAEKDAEIIRRIRASGGSVLGTVNMHEGALGATTDNEAYGRTKNPWNSEYTPGGSSGGSGAAVAAGLCDVALGTDTMGSVRIPAAYCGVQGHKPTYGLVPQTGVVPLSMSLDHVGPLARDVGTLWRAMHVLAAWGPAPDLQAMPLSGLRIGVWDGGESVALTPSVTIGFEAVLRSLREAGATLLPVSPPVYDYSRSRRAGLLVSEVEGAKEHGVTADGARPDGLSDMFYGLLHWGTRQSKEKVDAAYAHITNVWEAAAQVWQSVDFVIAPTAPQEAFRFTDTVPANQADFTAWADFAKLPATAIYTGLSPDRLPLSVQLIGPEGRDQDVLKAGAALEALLGKPPMPPGFEW
ncbi:MAG: Asp-tRNA(Asn)/Glu-tRNA(Gln) amidotransferase subunit GatA [Henriciella sp.]